MQVQIISMTERRAEIVLKGEGRSETLHLLATGAGYTDRWKQRHDLGQLTPTPQFLAGWYGVRALDAIRKGHNAYAQIRSACRYACRALPVETEIAA